MFHDIMASHLFSILYVIFLFYFVIKSKNGKTRNGLIKVNIMILLMLLLFPFLQSINSYIFKDVIDGVQNNRLSIISHTLFPEAIKGAEKIDKAENIMDGLMMANTCIDLIYPILIYGTICAGGIV